MNGRLGLWLAAALLVVPAGCTSKEKDASDDAGKEGSGKKAKPEVERPQVAINIASVQMVEDCPDPEPPPPPPAEAESQTEPEHAEKRAMEPAADEPAPGDSMGDGDFQQPCTQSRVQVEFANDGKKAATVKVLSAKVLLPDGKTEVGPVTARKPTRWKDGSNYVPWDQSIQSGETVKGSYKLSVPDWSKAEAALAGSSSFGKMFVLELVLEIDGEKQTVRSPQFPREEPEIIVT